MTVPIVKDIRGKQVCVGDTICFPRGKGGKSLYLEVAEVLEIYAVENLVFTGWGPTVQGSKSKERYKDQPVARLRVQIPGAKRTSVLSAALSRLVVVN